MKNFDCCFKRKLLALQPGMLSHIIKDQWLHFNGMPFIYVSVWLLSSDEKYMYGTVWDALRLFHSIFLPMSIPFQWILCWWVFVHTYLVTILGPSPQRRRFPIVFPSSLLPGLWGRLAAVRPRVAYSRASDVLAFCPLSVTAADCQWLPGWQSFTQLRRVLGSKCYHYCKEGCHHFLPLEHGSTPSKMAAVQWHSPLCEWQDIIAAVATMVHAHQGP